MKAIAFIHMYPPNSNLYLLEKRFQTLNGGKSERVFAYTEARPPFGVN